MELRCPDCFSPEVDADPGGTWPAAMRCGNCGERFRRGAALIAVRDAVDVIREQPPEPIFTFAAGPAEIELRRLDGAIWPINRFSDADELNGLLDGAQATPIIETLCERARISIYPLSIGEPDPILAVDPGRGSTLLGSEQMLRGAEDEDPVAFTIRVLGEMVEEANSLAAGRAADSERLDRIAAYLNRPGQWNGGDVCEFLATEVLASGRALADE